VIRVDGMKCRGARQHLGVTFLVEYCWASELSKTRFLGLESGSCRSVHRPERPKKDMQFNGSLQELLLPDGAGPELVGPGGARDERVRANRGRHPPHPAAQRALRGAFGSLTGRAALWNQWPIALSWTTSSSWWGRRRRPSGTRWAPQVALGLRGRTHLRFMSRKRFAQYTVPMVAILNAKRLDGMQRRSATPASRTSGSTPSR
jgi:hypothetical protein